MQRREIDIEHENFSLFQQSLNRAAGIANDLTKATGESFLMKTTFNKTKDDYVIELTSGTNPNIPFPLEKFTLIEDIISGFYKERTKQDFTKLEHREQHGNGEIVIRLYTGPCLNPGDFERMLWSKGSKAKLLNPEDCNGMETIISEGLKLIPTPNS